MDESHSGRDMEKRCMWTERERVRESLQPTSVVCVLAALFNGPSIMQ